jgi:hypothetical protein
VRVEDADGQAQDDPAEAGQEVIRIAAEAEPEAKQAKPQEYGEGAGVEQEVPERLAVRER